MRTGKIYSGENRRHFAMPLGGIGTGNVSLAGNGALRQWEIGNVGNHIGFVPQSFFALRLGCVEPPISFRRVLQTPALPAHPEPTPNVNDDFDPAPLYASPFCWPEVRGAEIEAAYPFARVRYEDQWPVEVELEAYTPFVPLDADASGLPLVSFAFTVTNRSETDITGWLFGSLQNIVGWDGLTPIRDSRCALLGGNTNRLADVAGRDAIVLENPSLPAEHPGNGSQAIWADSTAVPMPRFDDADAALRFVDSLKLLAPTVFEDWSDESIARSVAALQPVAGSPEGPSRPGRTWAGGLAVPFHLEPGASRRIEFVHTWHFPNRTVGSDQFGREQDLPSEAVPIGNHYCEVHPDAVAVLSHYIERRAELHRESLRWSASIFASDLPDPIAEMLASQPSLLRSPTTFRTADGDFYGYEGVLGESTLNWNGNVGGSCPVNCTHVWNYEQALATLFPALERSMRENDWDVLQAPEGFLPHRLILPKDAPQHHGRLIGGPDRPALDGMLGTVLKTYREARRGAGDAWLARYLPNIRRLMEYVQATWDPEGGGVLSGDQPVTHDISLQGPNMFVGGIYLAALRATEEMLAHLGHAEEASGYAERFELSTAAYDSLLWNGEYYTQISGGDSFDFGDGCLADQLFGQCWAHQLGLGYVLPEAHVCTALAAIVKHNFREGFRGFEHGYRVFADGDDAGLLICTWPHGGRPTVPIRYSDEVWTGVEYQVATHCFYEGMDEEGLKLVAAVRARYDGSRRNPFNEIECGDHYSRAMAGWAVLGAFTDASYDAVTGSLRLGDRIGRYPLFTGTGWGEVAVADRAVELRCHAGEIAIQSLAIADRDIASARVAVNHDVVPAGESMTIRAGDVLEVAL
jgi:non-lysosomal glucosylceramidase